MKLFTNASYLLAFFAGLAIAAPVASPMTGASSAMEIADSYTEPSPSTAETARQDWINFSLLSRKPFQRRLQMLCKMLSRNYSRMEMVP